MKLYKYRPLSELLFKELYYQEVYFASYLELNDPLDLSAHVDFTPPEVEAVQSLYWYLFCTTIKYEVEGPVTDADRERNRRLLKFNDSDTARIEFSQSVYQGLKKLSESKSVIGLEDLVTILDENSLAYDVAFDLRAFVKEIERLTHHVLKNSYACCFSSVNDDFLMWSHYSSKHTGICLEFDTSGHHQFPYVICKKRDKDEKKYLERMSDWNIEQKMYWDSIQKVHYQDEQPNINFFRFSKIFANTDDVDVRYISKSWVHEYAYELRHAFSTKTNQWSYEKEWRAIEVNLDGHKEPEERIRHYPIECITGIYFGLRTPISVKERIKKLFDELSHSVEFFDCVPTTTRQLTFKETEFEEA